MKVRDRYDRWLGAGASACFVVFDDPALVRRTMLHGLDDLPFPVLVDRDRESYARWGLARAPWWKIWLDGNVYKVYGQLLRAGERLSVGGVDVLQLGGDFVVGTDQRIAYSRAQQRDDRPPAAELLQHARDAGHDRD